MSTVVMRLTSFATRPTRHDDDHVERRARRDDDIARSRLIDEIRAINTTVERAWLGRFDEAQLASYRDHLLTTHEPRGRTSVWRRRAETPAIVAYSPAE